jgi:hypothetical protein
MTDAADEANAMVHAFLLSTCNDSSMLVIDLAFALSAGSVSARRWRDQRKRR